MFVSRAWRASLSVKKNFLSDNKALDALLYFVSMVIP